METDWTSLLDTVFVGGEVPTRAVSSVFTVWSAEGGNTEKLTFGVTGGWWNDLDTSLVADIVNWVDWIGLEAVIRSLGIASSLGNNTERSYSLSSGWTSRNTSSVTHGRRND